MEVFNKVDLAWVMSTSVVALLASWPHLGGFTQISAVWKWSLSAFFDAHGMSETIGLSKTWSIIWRSLDHFSLELLFFGP